MGIGLVLIRVLKANHRDFIIRRYDVMAMQRRANAQCQIVANNSHAQMMEGRAYRLSGKRFGIRSPREYLFKGIQYRNDSLPRCRDRLRGSLRKLREGRVDATIQGPQLNIDVTLAEAGTNLSQRASVCEGVACRSTSVPS